MKKQPEPILVPDRRPLTQSQAARLAATTGIAAEELAGQSMVEISDKFRWRIDPEILLFRRICGRVVKRDPSTGAEFPVPFAKVHVEDTDCSFLGFFPVENPWAWFFPIFCRREEIGTTTTDGCGRFCVWVPRFEIDWILHFRRERICFPDIFTKPTVFEILRTLEREPSVPHGPDPDPGPLLVGGPQLLQQAEQILGRDVTLRLGAIQAGTTLGSSAAERQRILAGAAFPQQLPPPLPAEFRPAALRSGDHNKAVRDTLSARLNLSAKIVEKFSLNHFVGPFRRCIDIITSEWVPILDVPDITFRVTQDVNGNGTEETIYSEGFFDVRWNAGNIPDVTLTASPIAISSHSCDVPDVPCGNTPAIQFAGLMPLVNPVGPADPYVDAGTGYARRPNRPHPSGAFVDPNPHPLAESPFTHVLQLYGCNRVNNAAFYRLRYSFNGGPLASFVGLTWPLYRVVAGNLQSLWPISDAAGWYPVLPAADNWFPDLLLLEWPTNQFLDGLYSVQLEVGNAAKNVIGTSSVVGFRIDNSAPFAQFTRLRWRKSGGIFQELPLTCPVIPRGVIPSDIEIEVSYTVSAAHLRSVQLGGGGCGGGSPTLLSALSTAEHWHSSVGDNSVSNTATFQLLATAPAGAYSFNLLAASRAFNPAGGDGGHSADWNYDPIYNYSPPSLPVAVVNAN